ncbi:MAG TPA: cytochrome P450 [Ktedonobacterales bacterium]
MGASRTSTPAADSSAHLEPIPHPPGMLVLGNLFDLNAETPVQGMMELARQHGPIFELELPGRRLVVVSGPEMVDELCDERRFDKLVWAPLRNVRSFAGDGLFTAWTQEANWKKAHNILLPNFSMQAMRGYLPMMVDLAQQLIQKWERLNPDDTIDVAADMTRLTLDTIGLCGFNYRFNSFYREEPHPFIVAMVRALGESLGKLSRLPVQNRLMVRTRKQFEDDITVMNDLVDKLIQERKAAGAQGEKRDLLGYMLSGVDKQSGEQLDDLNIRYQIITFLIAGHETTSGLLSFALYYLVKHPDVLQRAYDEVDRVLGADLTATPSFQQIGQLTYVGQILKESLRLWPTAPAFALYPYEPTTLAGKYAVDRQSEIMTLIPMLHRDRSIWGDDAEEFNPDHFSREREAALPPNAYKPFGNGQRACIGRQFALQEATLTLGMLLQRFELIDYADYQLKVKETLTLKPEDFSIRVRPRTTRAAVAAAPVVEVEPQVEAQPQEAPQHGTPLLILYGSNLGTAESLASQIAEDGVARGFAVTVAPLDDYTGNLPTKGAVLLVSASYNGQPPDNAARFVRWVSDPALAAGALRGVRYATFGVGDRDWAATYQAVPKLLDTQMAAHGATLIYMRGEGDARDDFDGQFRAWYASFWPAIAGALGVSMGSDTAAVRSHRYEVEVVAAQAGSPFAVEYDARPMRVRANRELQRAAAGQPLERSTRHIEVELPADLNYRAGDHLGVLPRNGEALVSRVLRRFGYHADAHIIIRSNSPTRSALPVGQAIAVSALLTSYLELQDPATRAQIQTLVAYCDDESDQRTLTLLAGDDEASAARYREQILARRVTLLDLLEQYPSVTLPFNIFLEMLQPLRPRYYSIASSPLAEPRVASVTVAVVDEPARSGRGQYAGVASTYLAGLAPAAQVDAFVRAPSVAFRLPPVPQTPLIMVGAGTGIAPYRGFLQERAALRAAGKSLGPALLFFGCRSPERDYLYQSELSAYEAQGLVTVYTAFSRVEGQPRVYVQDVIRERQEEVWALAQRGALIYVCGDASRMAPEVRRSFGAVYMAHAGGDEADGETWVRELTAQGRYLADVWPSN